MKLRTHGQIDLAALLLAGLLVSTSAKGSVLDINGEQHFVYRDFQGVIHDAYRNAADGWTLYQVNLKRTNSAAGTDGPQAADDPFVSLSRGHIGPTATAAFLRFTYLDGNGAIQDVFMDNGTVYPGEAGHLQQINLKQVNNQARTAAPAAAGDPFVLSVGTDKHFVYRDGSGTIWDARYNGAWSLLQINIIPITGGPLVLSGGIVGETDGPPAAGDPFVALFGQQQHFAYRDAAGNIQDAWYDGAGGWHLQQINNGPILCFSPCPPGHTPGPSAAGEPFVIVVGQQLHFAYRDLKGEIWDAWYDGVEWGLDQIPVHNTRAASGPIASVYSGQLHFTYRDVNGAIYDAWHVPGNQTWTLSQLNLGGLTNGPAAAMPSNSVALAGGSSGGSREDIDGLSVAVGAAGVYGIDGMCASLDSTHHFAYRDVNGNIQDVWYDGKGGWRLQEVLPRPPSQCRWPLKLVGPSTALDFTVGMPPSGVTFSASGGAGGYRFSSSGLPGDLGVNLNGGLIGAPMTPGKFSFTVTVKDSAGAIANGVFAITVSSPPPPATWTLTLLATPVPTWLCCDAAGTRIQINIDSLTWVVTSDWDASSQTIPCNSPSPGTASKSVSLRVPPGSVKTVTVTISGKWSTSGGGIGGFSIDPQSGSICSPTQSVCSPDSQKVTYKGVGESISWHLGVPWFVDQDQDGQDQLHFGVVSTFLGITP